MATHAKKKPDGSGNALDFSGRTSLTSGFDLFETQLDLWRQNLDLSRRMLRHQQDQALQFWRAQLSQFSGMLPDGAPGAAPPLFMPMLTAFKAGQQMSDAALEAQRSALDAMSPQTRT